MESLKCVKMLLCFLVFFLLGTSYAADSQEFTINVDAGRDVCFFVPVQKGQYLDIEYQVIDGEQGDIDIDFNLITPTGRLLVSEMKKPDSSHRHQADEHGDYRLCFDNSFSAVNAKTVYFEVSVETDDGDDDSDRKAEDDVWGENGYFAGLAPEEVLDIKVQDIKDVVARVRGNLMKTQHFQDQLRAFEARDRNIAESNYTRVNSWSLIQIAAMLGLGVIQVVMVRSLFDDKSRVHRLWKKTSTWNS